MVIDIPLPPSDVARLKARASEVGKSVEQVAADAVAHELSGGKSTASPSPANASAFSRT